MAEPEAEVSTLALPRGVHSVRKDPSRKARSNAGGVDQAPEAQQAPQRYQSKTAQTTPAIPDGRRCETCPHVDSQEDPVIKKLKALHKENWSVVVANNAKFFNLLRVTADGTYICWWGFAQKSTGETMNCQCGYCMCIYNTRVRPQKLTLKVWKGQLGSSTQMLDAHCKSVLFMVDGIVEKG